MQNILDIKNESLFIDIFIKEDHNFNQCNCIFTICVDIAYKRLQSRDYTLFSTKHTVKM